MRLIRSKAIFMMFLVVSLSIYTPFAFADITSDDVSVYGKDSFDGYLSGTDVLLINVTTPNIIKFADSPDANDFTCYNGTCFLTVPQMVSEDAGENFVLLQEFDASNNPIGTALNESYMVDRGEPGVNFTVEQRLSDEKVILTIYELNDTLSENITDDCSGIKSVILYEDSSEFLDFNLDSRAGECEGIGTGEYDLNITASGEYVFTIYVTDNVGNIHMSDAVELYVDFDTPDIPEDMFSVYKKNSSHEITTVSLRHSDFSRNAVNISFTIEDRNLDLTTVTADLKDVYFNDFYNEYYTEVPFTCVRNEDNVTNFCYADDIKRSNGNVLFDEITFDPEDEFVEITVYAEDLFGREMSKTITKSFTLDNSQPESGFIGTENCDDEVCYINDHTMNKLVFTTGYMGSKTVDQGIITADVGSLSPDGSIIQLGNCYPLDSGAYECYNYAYLDTAGVDEGDLFKIRLAYPSIDDAGNPFPDIDGDLIFDSVEPVFVSIDNYASSTWVERGEDFTVEVRVNDTTSGVKEIVANFSNIQEGKDDVVSDSCTQVDDTQEYLCIWEDKVQALETGNLTVLLEIVDYAGNVEFVNTSLVVLSVNDGSDTLPWSFSQNQTIPEMIDLVTLPYFPKDDATIWSKQLVLGDIDDEIPEILSIDLYDSGCVLSYDPEELNFSDNESALLENSVTGSKIFRKTLGFTDGSYLLLELDIAKQSLPPETKYLNYTCPVTIIGKKGYERFQPYNTNISVSVRTNSSEYEALKELKESIEDLKDDLKDMSIIDDIQGILDMLNEVCTLWNNVNLLYNAFSTVMEMTAFALTKVPPTWLTGKKVQSTDVAIGGALGDGLDKVMGPLCRFMSCATWAAAMNGDEKSDKDAATERVIIDFIGPLFGLGKSEVAKTVRGLNGGFYGMSQKSMLYAIIFLCIPGIVYNLKKQRNIDCQYVYCLEEEVKSGSMQIHSCGQRKAYSECLFVYGQFYNSLPFAMLVNAAANFIKEFANDPLAAGMMVFSLTCMNPVFEPGPWILACNIKNKIGVVTNAYIAITGIRDKYLSDDYIPPVDYCEEIGVD
ncbi:hypothetical protein BVX95_01105 [archaeon D22]|nr:hypothetical protein BVX95_01105 [archaeon D22]